MVRAVVLEWPFTLDITGLIAGGWRPIPFREFFVKIHTRCDLACDYCYMYEMADQSWRDRPRKMSMDVARHTALRIGEHARDHQTPNVALILHGGEPLLAGRELISELVCATHAAVGPGVAAPFRHLFSGLLLCTVDLRNDPVPTYKALTEFDPPGIDFLLPHGTWSSRPPGRLPGAADASYAGWLIEVFDHWYPSQNPRVRLFEDIVRLLFGTDVKSEVVGIAPTRIVVIETDGAIELADNLKVAYHAAPTTGLNVTENTPDDAHLMKLIGHIRETVPGDIDALRGKLATG
jgi:uncharacterized protein